MTVRLVDRFYNLITVGRPMTTVNVHPNDPSASDSSVSLTNGVATATITYLTQNNAYSATTNPVRNQLGWTLTATDLGATNYSTDISTYTAVWPGPVAKLRILTANQQASEGTTPSGPGKTNAASPGSGTAGVAFPVTIQAVDNYWNTNYGLGPQNLADIGDQVYVQTNDAYIQNDSTTPLINGQLLVAFSNLTPRTAQTNWTFSAVDVSSATISSQTVSGVNVSAASGGPLHYQILLPSESAAPGSGQFPAGGKDRDAGGANRRTGDLRRHGQSRGRFLEPDQIGTGAPLGEPDRSAERRPIRGPACGEGDDQSRRHRLFGRLRFDGDASHRGLRAFAPIAGGFRRRLCSCDLRFLHRHPEFPVHAAAPDAR